MKKMFSLAILGLFVFSMVGVSATTAVTGTVYHHPDITNPIANAEVVVSCAHSTSGGIVTNIRNTISDDSGWYKVEFSEGSNLGCDDGDVVTVYATTSNGLYGESEPKVVDNDVFGTWDFVMIHVPMVPEFGFFVGMLTILSATVVFFVVRRN